jgi:hypothetical protein
MKSTSDSQLFVVSDCSFVCAERQERTLTFLHANKLRISSCGSTARELPSLIRKQFKARILRFTKDERLMTSVMFSHEDKFR